MPAAPSLLRTRSHAFCRTSLRQIRSNSAWKRRPGSRLAARKSACWSSRTLSTGLLGLAAMPSHLPPATRSTKAGPLPSAGVVATGIDGTTNPSDSLPARLPFALGLWAPPSPDIGRWVGPLLFRVGLSSHALLSTPGKSCAAPVSDAVCCLRRDMIGSAFPPFGSLISRGCKVHGSPFRIGPATLLPTSEAYASTRALDAPLGTGDLSPGLEPARRRFGAYRGGTRTRKLDTA